MLKISLSQVIPRLTMWRTKFWDCSCFSFSKSLIHYTITVIHRGCQTARHQELILLPEISIVRMPRSHKMSSCDWSISYPHGEHDDEVIQSIRSHWPTLCWSLIPQQLKGENTSRAIEKFQFFNLQLIVGLFIFVNFPSLVRTYSQYALKFSLLLL